MLCYQIIQDALKRKLSDTACALQVSEVLNEGFQTLVNSPSDSVSVELLESFAKVRFSLSRVADILHRTTSKQTSQVEQLLQAAKVVCSNAVVNMIDRSGQHDTTGPSVYLMRVLVRRYGRSSLEKVASAYSWVIPEELTCTQEVRLAIMYVLVQSDIIEKKLL